MPGVNRSGFWTGVIFVLVALTACRCDGNGANGDEIPPRFTLLLETDGTLRSVGEPFHLEAVVGYGEPVGALELVWDLDGGEAAGPGEAFARQVSFSNPGTYLVSVIGTDESGAAYEAGAHLTVVEAVVYRVGDVDGSGLVAGDDYERLAAFLGGTAELTDEEWQRADVDLDGRVTETDLALVESAILEGDGLAPRWISHDAGSVGRVVRMIHPALLDPDAQVEVVFEGAPPFVPFRPRPGYANLVVPPHLESPGAVELALVVDGETADTWIFEVVALSPPSADPGALVVEAMTLAREISAVIPALLGGYAEAFELEDDERGVLVGAQTAIHGLLDESVYAFLEAFAELDEDTRGIWEQLALSNDLAEVVASLREVKGFLDAADLTHAIPAGQSQRVLDILCSVYDIGDLLSKVGAINDIVVGFVDYFHDTWVGRGLRRIPIVGATIRILSAISSTIAAITGLSEVVMKYVPQLGDHLLLFANPAQLRLGGSTAFSLFATVELGELCRGHADRIIGNIMGQFQSLITNAIGNQLPFSSGAFVRGKFVRENAGRVERLIYDGISDVVGRILDASGVEGILRDIANRICGLLNDPVLTLDPSIVRHGCAGGTDPGASWQCTSACLGTVPMMAARALCPGHHVVTGRVLVECGEECTEDDDCEPIPDICRESFCNTDAGRCDVRDLPDGLDCDDDDLCTTGQECQGGECVGGATVTCEDPEECKDNGMCNPETGECEYPNLPNGTECTQVDKCREALCTDGVCQPGQLISCDTLPCQVSLGCEPAEGCQYEDAPDGVRCGGNRCNTACLAGECMDDPVVCDPPEPCYEEGVCNPSTGACTYECSPFGTPCGSGGECNVWCVCAGEWDPEVPVRTLVPNAAVSAIAVDDDGTVYIGGSFTRVGPPTGRFVAIDRTTGDRDPSWPIFEGGDVTVVTPDGQGGWYVGGNFTRVNEVPWGGLAHVRADGTHNPAYDPAPDGPVRALLVHDGLLYAGGDFAVVDGQPRAGLAALDGSGAATGFDPDPNGPVHALASDGDILYVGGDFSSIGMSARDGLAALTTMGTVTDWNPGAGGDFPQVDTLAVDGGVVYAGGYFTLMGGQSRRHLAAIETDADGTVTDWNPGVESWAAGFPEPGMSPVMSLVVDGGRVYAGGLFQEVGGEPREGIAAIETALDEGQTIVSDWSPDGVGEARDLVLVGGVVYVAGWYGQGMDNRYLFAIDSNGEILDWNPLPNASVQAIGLDGDTIFAGGSFTSVGGEARSYLAAFDADGSLEAFAPEIDGWGVTALALGDGVLYVGGNFSGAGGEPRQRLAAFDTTDGSLLPWNPGADGQIHDLAVSGSVVYLGGTFDDVAGQPRSKAAAVAGTGTGAVLDWDPGVTGGTSPRVNALDVADGVVYLGGRFGFVGGEGRSNVAAVGGGGTGTVLDWNPGAAGGSLPQVNALSVSGGVVYLGGAFTDVGGATREHLAAVSATGDGVATGWAPQVNGQVHALAASTDAVHAFGFFTEAGGEPRSYLAAFEAAGVGAVTDWDPGADTGGSSVMTMRDGKLYLGGFFKHLGGRDQSHFAVFELTP